MRLAKLVLTTALARCLEIDDNINVTSTTYCMKVSYIRFGRCYLGRLAIARCDEFSQMWRSEVLSSSVV